MRIAVLVFFYFECFVFFFQLDGDAFINGKIFFSALFFLFCFFFFIC